MACRIPEHIWIPNGPTKISSTFVMCDVYIDADDFVIIHVDGNGHLNALLLVIPLRFWPITVLPLVRLLKRIGKRLQYSLFDCWYHSDYDKIYLKLEPNDCCDVIHTQRQRHTIGRIGQYELSVRWMCMRTFCVFSKFHCNIIHAWAARFAPIRFTLFFGFHHFHSFLSSFSVFSLGIRFFLISHDHHVIIMSVVVVDAILHLQNWVCR